MRKVTIYGGKYTLCIPEKVGENFRALRYGEEWRDLCGDGLVLALAQEVEALRGAIEKAECCLVCFPIADPVEVYENTLRILQESKSDEP